MAALQYAARASPASALDPVAGTHFAASFGLARTSPARVTAPSFNPTRKPPIDPQPGKLGRYTGTHRLLPIPSPPFRKEALARDQSTAGTIRRR
jgi:hypothetical protein